MHATALVKRDIVARASQFIHPPQKPFTTDHGQPARVRAVCYPRFVRGLLASMAKHWTTRISRPLISARAQPMGPWGWIVDETRDAERVHVWNNPAAFVRTVKRRACRDHWA
jgi:hypothetical protein